MKFSLMPYERPDVDALVNKINELTEKLNAAADFSEADAVMLEFEKLTGDSSTMFTIASIRHDINTEDEFYDEEVNFADEATPRLEEPLQNWRLALLKSPFRSDFEAKYGKVYFLNTEISLKTFSPEIFEDLQKENALTTEYSKLLASAQIDFEGSTYTLSQLTPLTQDPDDERRAGAWKASDSWFCTQQERLDSLYDELVKLRDSMGKKLGYDGYTELGYYRMTRNCYTKEDVEKFRKAVVDYIVPLASKVYMRQAERLGKSYPMGYADNALSFRSGNACPKGSAEDILAQGKKFYHELSEETAEFIDVMLDNELMDVLSRKGKSSGGYCTNLFTYNVPFIFANFNGTSGDVEVITHEAGHAFAGWLAREVVPADCQWPTLEACEVHSMSMEFFAWPWAEGFFGDEARKFRYSHLADALTFIPYGTMVDHFQHIVYEHPEKDAAWRAQQWKELTAVYMPWIKLEEDVLPFYASGRYWQRQRHIYESPFYYIDYCLAQTVALQFWALIQKNPKAAWEKYMAYTRPAGSMTFTDLIAQADMASPFGSEALKEVSEAASKWLDEYDLTGIE